MRIGVIGAGALGGLLAAELQRAGHEVQVITRGIHRDTIAAHGITIRSATGTHRVQVTVTDRLDRVDLTLICVKAHDTAQAIAEHHTELETGPIVLVQNGIDGMTIARTMLPHAELFGAISLVAANFTEPGVIAVTNPQPTFIGRGPGAADAESISIAAVLNDAIPTRAIDAFDGALWTKLVFNMVNALPAITGLSVQAVAQHRTLLNVVAASMREAARVGIAAGVPFARLEGLDETVIRSLARWPLWRTRRMLREIAHGMGPIPNLASMLQSIRRGRPTEIEFLNGAIVKTAERAGHDAPVNRALTELVHRVEATGQHLGPAEVRTALRELGVRL